MRDWMNFEQKTRVVIFDMNITTEKDARDFIKKSLDEIKTSSTDEIKSIELEVQRVKEVYCFKEKTKHLNIVKMIRKEKLLIEAGELQHKLNTGELSAEALNVLPKKYKKSSTRKKIWAKMPKVEIIRHLTGDGQVYNEYSEGHATLHYILKKFGAVKLYNLIRNGIVIDENINDNESISYSLV